MTAAQTLLDGHTDQLAQKVAQQLGLTLDFQQQLASP